MCPTPISLSILHNTNPKSLFLSIEAIYLYVPTMSHNPKDSEQFFLSWNITKLVTFCFLLTSISYFLYSLGVVTNSHDCDNKKAYLVPITHLSDHNSIVNNAPPPIEETTPEKKPPPFEIEPTNISHIVFGIGASSNLWNHRKEYIKLWWKPNETRGNVWLDQELQPEAGDEFSLPRLRVSGDTSKFKYKHPNGDRNGIRISRIVSETVRLLKMEKNDYNNNVRWFVMGDDDTVFVTENLVKVLQKYDHNQFYYIGGVSESHVQNIKFSYNMAYGGGGFAISYSLALALEKMQDRCIQRYPALYGSDDRIQACMAELGVPLTIEKGFHQFDVYGNVFGLLTAHPITPLISLHHLDLLEPIFPNTTQLQSLQKLQHPISLDPYSIMQQSICYDKSRVWTVSVSWGYAVQIFRRGFSAREMEMPARTFLNWYRRVDYTGFPFNTRPFSRNSCQKPFVYYFENVMKVGGGGERNESVTRYLRVNQNPKCKWKMADPEKIQVVEVVKKHDPYLWDKSPRRNCCRVQPTKEEGTLVIDVGECREDEVVAL